MARRTAPPAARSLPKSGELARFRARVLAMVARIPRGQVATYGQISILAGHPRRARVVGQALHHNDEAALPWHRVINSQGRVSARSGETRPRGDEPIERRQERLLKAEGVTFRNGRVDLRRYRWRPEQAPLGRTQPRRRKT